MCMPACVLVGSRVRIKMYFRPGVTKYSDKMWYYHGKYEKNYYYSTPRWSLKTIWSTLRSRLRGVFGQCALHWCCPARPYLLILSVLLGLKEAIMPTRSTIRRVLRRTCNTMQVWFLLPITDDCKCVLVICCRIIKGLAQYHKSRVFAFTFSLGSCINI